MAEKEIRQKYDLACTYLKNKQTSSAHGLFLDLAANEEKKESYKAGLFFLLAAECKIQQGKDGYDEILKAGNLYLSLAKKEKSQHAKNAYLCAAKCFLKIGQYEVAKNAFEKSKKFVSTVVENKRPIVVVDDSPAIIMKISSHLEKLGYKDVHAFKTGKEALSACKKLIQSSQDPIVLLDMGLPDIAGDVVATKLLHDKPDLSIILITADEKTSKRVHKTISLGATAFIQKPFGIDDLKDALATVEFG
ncbi:MAG TPA: response regulator [Nitrosopumilaceae archaeon]|nr:response regulator [Nitrosopumilaceae archaeon]